ENYDRFICSMAKHPHIAGLLILENRSPALLFKAAFLILSMSAPRMGWTLIKNYFGNSYQRRLAAFQKNGKKVWTLPTINGPEALALIQQEKIDLVLNSRTRYIFKKDILEAPRLG